MKIIMPLAALATVAMAPTAAVASESSQSVEAATEEAAQKLDISRGTMLYGAEGNRIERIYRVTSSGDAQLIIDGKMITVPASTLSEADGKLTTSLSKREVSSAR